MTDHNPNDCDLDTCAECVRAAAATESLEALSVTIARLRRMRHAIAMTAPKPDADGSLVPLLTASAEACAIDVALRVLERELKGALV